MNSPTVLGIDDILAVLSTWTRIPVDQLGVLPSDVARYDALATVLNEKILSQQGAVEAVVRHLKRAALRPASATAPQRPKPRGSFLLYGPSGVGKSSLPQILAPELYGEGSLVQVDCSNLDQEHTLARLVGSPPGYVGHGAGGELTNAVRARGFGVLLFDELEKAHADFATKILIPILGEGAITDMNTGEILDLSGFLIFATTNLRGSEALDQFFHPAVLGRFDDVVGFDHLNHSTTRLLIDLQLRELETALRVERPNLRIRLAESAADAVVSAASANIERQGARAVAKAFRHEIEDRVLERLLLNREKKEEHNHLSIIWEAERIQVRGDSPRTSTQEERAMFLKSATRMPGRDILSQPEVAGLKKHEEDIIFLVNPETEEYTQVRPDRDYTLEPGTEFDVAPRTDRGTKGAEGS